MSGRTSQWADVFVAVAGVMCAAQLVEEHSWFLLALGVAGGIGLRLLDRWRARQRRPTYEPPKFAGLFADRPDLSERRRDI